MSLGILFLLSCVIVCLGGPSVNISVIFVPHKSSVYVIECKRHYPKEVIELKAGVDTIYKSSTGYKGINHHKYEVHDSEGNPLIRLNVKNANYGDATVYRCEGKEELLNKSMLIVTSEPEIHDHGTHIENESLTMICTTRYFSPNKGDCENSEGKSKEICPTVLLIYDGKTFNDTLYKCDPPDESGIKDCTAQRTYTTTPNRTDEGKMRQCILKATGVSMSVQAPLVVKYSVTQPKIFPKEKTYVIGQKLNCSSRGYPVPEYHWENQNSNKTVNCQELIISRNMTGRNSWACLAENYPGIRHFVAKSYIDFEVVTETREEDSESTCNLSIWILIGIIIPLVVGLLGLIIYVLYLKGPLNCSKRDFQVPLQRREEEFVLVQPICAYQEIPNQGNQEQDPPSSAEPDPGQSS